MAANRPHFHVWAYARGEKFIYRVARAFHTQQAASKWAKRHYPDRKTEVKRCWEERCAPKLD